jgi:copper homeostasis protein (lipoprotein)
MHVIRLVVALVSLVAFVDAAPRAFVQRVPSTDQTLIGVFDGLRPCADCSGRQTRLTLYAEGPTIRTSGTFLLKDTYIGRDVTNESAGRWRIVVGTPTDPKASIYELTSDKTGSQEFWLRVSPDELRLLDKERRDVTSPAPQVLRRSNR